MKHHPRGKVERISSPWDGAPISSMPYFYRGHGPQGFASGYVRWVPRAEVERARQQAPVSDWYENYDPLNPDTNLLKDYDCYGRPRR